MFTTTQVLNQLFPLEICKLILRNLIVDIIDVKTLSYGGCRCGEKGAFCKLEMGGDYMICPQCDHAFSSNNYICSVESIHTDLHMCPECKLMFDNHCSHAVNGCTDDVYYSKLITGFHLDNTYFTGSPKFNDIKQIEVLARTCRLQFLLDCWSTLNGRTFCPKAYYKFDKTPEHYHNKGTCKQTKFTFLKLDLKS